MQCALASSHRVMPSWGWASGTAAAAVAAPRRRPPPEPRPARSPASSCDTACRAPGATHGRRRWARRIPWTTTRGSPHRTGTRRTSSWPRLRPRRAWAPAPRRRRFPPPRRRPPPPRSARTRWLAPRRRGWERCAASASLLRRVRRGRERRSGAHRCTCRELLCCTRCSFRSARWTGSSGSWAPVWGLASEAFESCIGDGAREPVASEKKMSISVLCFNFFWRLVASNAGSLSNLLSLLAVWKSLHVSAWPSSACLYRSAWMLAPWAFWQ